MRNLFVTALTAAALLSAGALTTRSDAMTPAKPAGLHTAIKASKTVTTVRFACHRGGWARHGRNGRCFAMARHHNFRHHR